MKKIIIVLFAIAFLIGLVISLFLSTIMMEKHYEAVRARKVNLAYKLEQTPDSNIVKDPKLFTFAKTEGNKIFVRYCESCHGPAGGGKGDVPPLDQGKLLKSGALKDIAHAIRSGYEGANATFMFGYDRQLNKQATSDVADYVLSLSGKIGDAAAIERGKVIYLRAGCIACHQVEGKGLKELGVSSLSDNKWLYGGTKFDIIKSIEKGRVGLSHVWGEFIDNVRIKMVAAYVWSLR